MGLDMYLSSKHYVQNWEFHKPEERHNITITKGDQPTKIDTERVSYIIVSEAYWRKANAIHKWFVDHVQGGNDDCNEYRVSRDQLQQLLNTVKQVLADPSKAGQLLPTQAGFFFGSYDYDEYYIEDLTETERQLTRILAQDHDGSYYYQSSW